MAFIIPLGLLSLLAAARLRRIEVLVGEEEEEEGDGFVTLLVRTWRLFVALDDGVSVLLVDEDSSAEDDVWVFTSVDRERVVIRPIGSESVISFS